MDDQPDMAKLMGCNPLKEYSGQSLEHSNTINLDMHHTFILRIG
jgi:hypothetical protein